jgi:hypothetical protein
MCPSTNTAVDGVREVRGYEDDYIYLDDDHGDAHDILAKLREDVMGRNAFEDNSLTTWQLASASEALKSPCNPSHNAETHFIAVY